MIGIGITITAEAYAAIKATLPAGTLNLAYQSGRTRRRDRLAGAGHCRPPGRDARAGRELQRCDPEAGEMTRETKIESSLRANADLRVRDRDDEIGNAAVGATTFQEGIGASGANFVV
jgi:hypothetical protein